MPTHPSVTVIGAGIIGLCCAVELASRGVPVRLVEDDQPGRGATFASGGMLAPSFEASSLDCPEFLDLCLAGSDLWREFSGMVSNHPAQDLGYASGGSLAVATSNVQVNELRELAKRMSDQSIPFTVHEEVSDLRVKHSLSDQVSYALELHSDGWVNVHAVVQALRTQLSNLGVDFGSSSILEPDFSDIQIVSAWRSDRNGNIRFPEHLESWDQSHGMSGVEGVMLAYDSKDLPLDRVIRCGHEYGVPRGDVTLFGATVGNVDNPEDVLQTSAHSFLDFPGNVSPLHVWSRHRPRFEDGLPRIGAIDSQTYVALGHYRNGILLAPITAKLIADMILNEPIPEFAARFMP